MTHEDLIEVGFKLFGVEEDDPYYKLIYEPPFNFNISDLAGQLTDDVFELYGNNEKYYKKEELQKVILILGKKIRKEKLRV